MTTVEAPAIQRHLARIRDAGARYAVVEASSHGLAMHRVDQCEFDVSVFTNLAPDHLDYHETMERYRDAKATLFHMLDQSVGKPGVRKTAVLNADDEASSHMRTCTHQPQLFYGMHESAVLRSISAATTAAGTGFEVLFGDEEQQALVPLLGAFNVSNSLAALAVALSQDVLFASAVAALASFPGVPGRMELIDEGQPFRVVVDIASTEQAMRNVLGVLRPLTPGKLIVVFGAAGERDRERRAGMARAVAASADHAIITNEDPRTEDADAIIDEIAAGLAACGYDASRTERIADRRSALARAFELARREDTVLLAGKGTEQSIVIGTTHHPWDERAVAHELLREVVGV
jgi:UDP-N-acetylmuramoyl-L-alanyl-D-glutamate--2,6-diaminopimelate ligase